MQVEEAGREEEDGRDHLSGEEGEGRAVVHASEALALGKITENEMEVIIRRLNRLHEDTKESEAVGAIAPPTMPWSGYERRGATEGMMLPSAAAFF